MDWGELVLPISHRGQVSNSSKSGEKRGGGGEYNSGIKSRYTGLGKFQNKRHSCSNVYINKYLALSTTVIFRGVIPDSDVSLQKVCIMLNIARSRKLTVISYLLASLYNYRKY